MSSEYPAPGIYAGKLRGCQVSKKNPLEVEGRVVEPLPNGMFSVELENGQKVTAHISNSARLTFIRVIPGDKVLLELSPYDHTRGRITHRFK